MLGWDDVYLKHPGLSADPYPGGGLQYETDGDACGLA